MIMSKKQYNGKVLNNLNKLKKYHKEYLEDNSNEKYKFESNERTREIISNKINLEWDEEKIQIKSPEELIKDKYCDACECNPCDCDWGN